MSQNVNDALSRLWALLDARIAGTQLTTSKILVVLLLLAILIWITGRFTRWLMSLLLRRKHFDAGVVEEIFNLLRYTLIGLGVIVILQGVGVNLSALSFLLAALGVGLGFGLQNITSNFVSGLIILFERPVKVGDRIRVGEAIGTVRRIAIRATTLLTDDHATIIVPNSDFISQRVTNWRSTATGGRVSVKVRVSYQKDPAPMRDLLAATTSAEPWVDPARPVEVALTDMSDGWIHFELRAWARDAAASDAMITSLNLAVWRVLNAARTDPAPPA